MGLYDRNVPTTTREREAISSFSTRVYGWMSLGLGFTAAVAFFIFKTGLYAKLLPLWWVWGLGTFALTMGIASTVKRASFGTVAFLFMAFAGMEGMLFGTILPTFAAAFGGGVIWAAFAVGSAIFLTAMAFGIFTRSDLTSLGRILMFGLIGLCAVSLIFFLLSFFIDMTLAHLFISYIGLIIFVGLTAFDAQNIRRMSLEADNSVMAYKLSLVMALQMYMNVIMIFWYLLQIFSSNRR